MYNEWAEQTLRVFHDAMDQNAYGTSAMLCTLDLYLSKQQEVVIMGVRRNSVIESFTAAVHRRYVTNKILFLFDESRCSQECELPLAAGKVSVNGLPTAQVCQRSSYSQPMTEQAQLERSL